MRAHTHPGRAILRAAKFVAAITDTSECQRRHVACALVDAGGRILSSAVNAQADRCQGGPPGTCGCVHAEINALIRLDGAEAGNVNTIIVTAAPCKPCALALYFSLVCPALLLFFEDSAPGVEGLAFLESKGISAYKLSYGMVGFEPRQQGLLLGQ